MPKLDGHQIDPAHWRSAERTFRENMGRGHSFDSEQVLPVRAMNVLKIMGAHSKDEARRLNPADYLRLPNCGRHTSAAILMWCSLNYSPPI